MLFTRSGSRLLIGLLAAAVVLTGLLASPAHARPDKRSMAGIGTATFAAEGAATSERRLRRVAGAMQVRLLGDQSDVYAIGGQ